MLPSGPAGPTFMTFAAVHESPVGPLCDMPTDPEKVC
jgi:hypothetical protein